MSRPALADIRSPRLPTGQTRIPLTSFQLEALLISPAHRAGPRKEAERVSHQKELREGELVELSGLLWRVGLVNNSRARLDCVRSRPVNFATLDGENVEFNSTQ